LSSSKQGNQFGGENLEEIGLGQAARLLFPRLTVLVTSASPSDEPNCAPYSWVMPCSFQPARLCLGIQRKETLTVKNIKRGKEFVVNVVTRDWAQEAVNCEAKQDDKVEKSGIKLRESKKVKPKTVEQAKIVLECRLFDIVSAGDHYLVIGEIVHAEKAEGLENKEILMHLSGEKFVNPGEEFSLERKK